MKSQPLTPEIAYQLGLDLKVEDVIDDASERRISVEEAQLIANSARDALEAGSIYGSGKDAPTWLDDYRELREAGWPWRVACYMAWAASPRGTRWPANQVSLARDVLGLRGDRAIRIWRSKNPAIEAAIGMLQAKALFEHRRDVFQALVESATTNDHKNHPDRKLFLEMTGDYTPRNEVDLRPPTGKDDYSQFSEAELAAAEQALKGRREPEVGAEGDKP